MAAQPTLFTDITAPVAAGDHHPPRRPAAAAAVATEPAGDAGPTTGQGELTFAQGRFSLLALTAPRETAEGFLTVRQAAELLGVSGRTIFRRLKDGSLRKAELGGRAVRIPASEIARVAGSDGK